MSSPGQHKCLFPTQRVLSSTKDASDLATSCKNYQWDRISPSAFHTQGKGRQTNSALEEAHLATGTLGSESRSGALAPLTGHWEKAWPFVGSQVLITKHELSFNWNWMISEELSTFREIGKLCCWSLKERVGSAEICKKSPLAKHFSIGSFKLDIVNKYL